MQQAIWKENKTVKEWLALMPAIYIDKIALTLLLGWCCLPAFLMIFNLIAPTKTDRIHYMTMLGIGILGILLGTLSWFKVKNSPSYVKKTCKELFFNYGDRIFLLFMLTWGFFSCFFAKDIRLAFSGTAYRHDGFFSYVAYTGFFITALVLKEERYRKVLLYVFTSVVTLLSILTILQFYRVPMRVFLYSGGAFSAIFQQFNHFGYYLTIGILICSGLFVFSKKILSKIYLLIEFILMIFDLCINNTFGCYLAVIGGLAVMLIGFWMTEKKHVWKVIILILTFAILSVTLNSTYGLIGKNYKSLASDAGKIISNAGDKDNAGSSRWGLWTDAIHFILEKPIWGYGIENSKNAYEGYKKMPTDRPHNEYLQHAVFMGIPALLFYLSALVWILYRAIKQRKKLSNTTIVALCAAIAYMFSAFFGNTMFYTTPYFMIVLAMASMCPKIKSEVND